MNFKEIIIDATAAILGEAAAEKGITIHRKEILVSLTPQDFTGDYTVVLFPFIKKLGKSPAELGDLIGNGVQASVPAITGFNLVKGFLNFEIGAGAWASAFAGIHSNASFGIKKPGSEGISIALEYPSPNTNKPLHLGHLRNIFLGFSLSRILEANGNKVIQVCLYNDRGTNISKSMLSYLDSASKETPESSGIKGDKLVGDYYVAYASAYKKEIAGLVAGGKTEEEAKKESALERRINELTLLWEQDDAATRRTWEMMNGWFYKGVQQTYDLLGLKFDKFYYESDVYHLGKETVEEGIEKGVFFRKEDGSVWIDLEDIGLDKKLVLRSNGTSVYITQDMALAYKKQEDFDFSKSIYVVGNEQDYHFKVLFEILRRLGMKASAHLHHLSYGMVELPTGKMKSREGTVVDADDLIVEVIEIAQRKANEQGKLAEADDGLKMRTYRDIGLGALRYFILKVDPAKKMIFNPEESIDFNGNTAPFIQYIYARTQSLKRNAEEQKESTGLRAGNSYLPNDKEQKLIRLLSEFPEVVKEAGDAYSPALIANYTYHVAADFSTYYHDYKVLKEEDPETRNFRLALTDTVGRTIREGLYLLGIDAPERM